MSLHVDRLIWGGEVTELIQARNCWGNMNSNYLRWRTVSSSSEIDTAHFEVVAKLMCLQIDDPAVVARVNREKDEARAMEYAGGVLRAAMDALTALDVLEMVSIFDGYGELQTDQHEAGLKLVGVARRQLRSAVGDASDPVGRKRLCDMLLTHGFDING